jgi:hypothetical protein
MELVERVDAQAETGIWRVRSASTTTYLLDTLRRSQPRMMRLTSPHGWEHGWWDDSWMWLISVTASQQLDLTIAGHPFLPGTEEVAGVLRVGSRHLWVADSLGWMGEREKTWWSRMATSIERLDEVELTALLAEHGVTGGTATEPH